MKLLLVILFLVNVNLLGSKIDNKVYDKKSNQYYKQYKKEFDRLPLKNKKKILEAYYTNEAYDLGFTMAGTMFLENRGKDTSYSNLDEYFDKERVLIMGAPYPLYTGDIQFTYDERWAKDGRVMIVQDKPMPLTVIATMQEVSLT